MDLFKSMILILCLFFQSGWCNTPPVLVVIPRQWKIPVNEMLNHPVAEVRVSSFGNADINFKIEKSGSGHLHRLQFKDASKYFTLHQRGPNALKVYLTKDLGLEFAPGDKLTLSIAAISGSFTVRHEVFIEIEEPHVNPFAEIQPVVNNTVTNQISSQEKVTLKRPEEKAVPIVTPKNTTGIVAMNVDEAKDSDLKKQEKDKRSSEKSFYLVLVLLPLVFVCPLFAVGACCFRHHLKRLGSSLCCQDDGKKEEFATDELKIESANGEFSHEMQFKENSRKISTSSGNSHLYISSPNGVEVETVLGEDLQWEFPRHQLKIIDKIGEGCFGQVWKYEAENIGEEPGKTIVAVKTLKNTASEKEKRDLLHELEIMKMLDPHPNVVRLLGCCTDKEPIYIILEFVNGGTLQDFLRKSRSEQYYRNLHGESQSLTARDLTSFALQIAKGMAYLASKKVIHRDLAARNVLIDDMQVCKVADFGFARDIMANNIYERKSEGRLPIRWMSPESLYDNCYTTKSDVWSFGVLMWEIVALGSTPYPGKSASEVMKFVRDSGRLEKPPHCDRQLYNIMSYCWAKDPEDRPGFEELVGDFESLLVQDTDYIDLNMFPEHGYYNEVGLSDEKV